MKSLLIVIATFFAGVFLSSALENEATRLPVVDVIQTSSNPKKLKPFTEKQLTKFLANWTHVEKRDFYYETLEGVAFPFQEGTLTFQDGTEGKWKYYHCGGLRIDVVGEKARYLLSNPKK